MQRPLTGIRVMGTDQYIAGPYCTMLLADAGAEVIKIERPGAGDPRRAMPPFAERDGKRRAGGFMAYNRNKKSLALDLRSEAGKAVFKKLAGECDVLVDNLRPGSLERQGLGYGELKAINPRLVYAVISGFGRLPGRRGPYADRPAFDIVAEAMSGIMHMVGFEDKPPSWTIYGLADIYSGMVGAYGIMQALFMRERTGEGQFVDSAMYDNMLSLNESMIALHSVDGQSPHRGRPRNAYPRSAYHTKDGYIALNVPDERIWARLADTMGHPQLTQDERTRSAAARIANRDYLDPIIEGWLKDLTREEAVERLNVAGVPAGSVFTVEDIFACPQVAARSLLMPVNDPEVGEYRFARTPPMLSSTPDLPAVPAPRLGQHTREVLEDLLGYGAEEVSALAAVGVVQVEK
ncbi:MAG: CoA transferase [Gammaproteobacteria bacterium]|nr:CoA transferase [Gammaproteobacteria bacterium]